MRKSFKPLIDEDLAAYDDLIFEAAFLSPAYYLGAAKLFLIISNDEQLHRQHYYAHRNLSKESETGYQAARMIQSYLIREAGTLGIMICNNQGSVAVVADMITAEIRA